MPDLNTDLTAFIETAEAAIDLIAAGLWQSDTGCVGCVAQDSCGREEGEPLACHEALAMLKRSIPALARVAMAAPVLLPCDNCADNDMEADECGIPRVDDMVSIPCRIMPLRAALAALSVALEENR